MFVIMAAEGDLPAHAHDERWEPAAGFEYRYKVSSLGTVFDLQLDRRIGSRTNEGYAIVHLVHRDGSREYIRVGRLVLLTFVGQPPFKGAIARHGPKGNLDDSLDNLCWGTRGQNNGPDKQRDGTIVQGEAIKQAKLTEEKVREIRLRARAGMVTKVMLADAYGVSVTVIYDVISRRTWKHVTDE
jgi:hypothetical protein